MNQTPADKNELRVDTADASVRGRWGMTFDFGVLSNMLAQGND